MIDMSFPFSKQPDAMDCGPACLCMIAEHYGKQYVLEHLRDSCFIGREGVSMQGISKAAEKIGFHTVGGKLTFDKLITHVRKLLMETTGVFTLYLVLHTSCPVGKLERVENFSGQYEFINTKIMHDHEQNYF